MKQTTVYLIRHGMYENPDHLNPGRSPGFPLSSLGKQEVVTLATLLSQEPISAVFSSPILRTRETAEMLARNFNLPVSIDDRLSEVGGPFNGVPSIDVDALTRVGKLYTKKYFDLGLEPIPQFFQRMDDCLKEIVRKNKRNT